MSTSDNRYLKTSFIYLIVSIVLMIAGAVYEHFSFGVYSYFMIYAFAIPLAGGALPFLAKYMKDMRGAEASSGAAARITAYSGAADATAYSGAADATAYSGAVAEASSSRRHEAIYHLSLATLTAGSIVHGILAICGRPNSLTVIYLIAGLLLLAVTALSAVRYSANRMQGPREGPIWQLIVCKMLEEDHREDQLGSNSCAKRLRRTTGRTNSAANRMQK
ncbi:MAG: hypothetical protein J6D57_12285 [Mogibacterium sp.]|nr:hypothetical protein [Mogibacterium sp.]